MTNLIEILSYSRTTLLWYFLVLLSVMFGVTPVVVQADSLYSSSVTIGPNHPFRLIGDHRAIQVGDLLAVTFNYAAVSSDSAANAQKKATDLSLGAGTGIANLPLMGFPSAYTAGSDSSSSRQKSDTSSFSTVMMATVVGVLNSGALVIKGDESVVIDGQKHICHVKGTVRPEDIDNTDTVTSSRIADVEATFDGNNKSDHHGLIQKVLDVLF